MSRLAPYTLEPLGSLGSYTRLQASGLVLSPGVFTFGWCIKLTSNFDTFLRATWKREDILTWGELCVEAQQHS